MKPKLARHGGGADRGGCGQPVRAMSPELRRRFEGVVEELANMPQGQAQLRGDADGTLLRGFGVKGGHRLFRACGWCTIDWRPPWALISGRWNLQAGRQRLLGRLCLYMDEAEHQVVVALGCNELQRRAHCLIRSGGLWRRCSPPCNSLVTPPQDCLNEVLHLPDAHQCAFLTEVSQAALVEIRVPMGLQQRLETRQEEVISDSKAAGAWCCTGALGLGLLLWRPMAQDQPAQRLVE
mmetsp:Transcript_142784/g.397732  ORF Transcript_142784/g.397732 Transcript_142784/m.397732 type:complete len:237 (-) Transcript_142784:381-1091(-)